MTRSRRFTFLPLAGVAAVLLWTTGLLAMDSVRPDAETSQAILEHFQTNSLTVQLATYATQVGSLFFLVFLAALWTRLRTAEGDGGGLAAVVFATGMVVGIGQIALFGTDLDAALDADAIDASTAEAYYYLGDHWFIAALWAAVLMLVAASVVILRTRLLPRWVGWAGIVVAVLLIPQPVGWFVWFLGFPAWIVVVSILLSRSGARAGSNAQPVPPITVAVPERASPA